MIDKNDLPVLLIVEDDEGLQRQLKWSYEGYRVVTASNRLQASPRRAMHPSSISRLPDETITTENVGVLPRRGERWSGARSEDPGTRNSRARQA